MPLERARATAGLKLTSSRFVLLCGWVRARSFHCIYPQETRRCLVARGRIQAQRTVENVHHRQSQECRLLIQNYHVGTNSNTAAYGLFSLPSLCGRRLASRPESLARGVHRGVIRSRGRVRSCSPSPRAYTQRPWDWDKCAGPVPRLRLRVALEDFENNPQRPCR